MKKSAIIAIILAIVIVGGGGLFVLANRSDDGKQPEATSSQTNQSESTAQSPDPVQPTEEQSEINQVEISDMAFRPDSVTVKKGTTVTWTNRDSIQHDVTPDQESDAFDGSELLSKNESYSFTFNTPGTYTYHCSPHPQMTGTITVTE